MELFSLRGRNAVVTGGGGGLGTVIAQGLAEAGAKILLADCSEEALARSVKELLQKGIEAQTICFDISNEDSVKRLLTSAVERLGNIEILVNAHGLNRKLNIQDFSPEEWDRVFAVNVRGTMLTCKHFGRHMKANGYGKIVTLSSVRGEFACGGGNSAYCATKGAVNMMTKSLSSELGPEVRINCLAPAHTMTATMKKMAPPPGVNLPPMEELMKMKPLQRMATPEDLIGPTVFLCAAAGDFVTGQVLYPDGGFTAVL